jgi:hypothetical protein
MLMDYKERSVNFKKAGELPENEREEKILVGEFVENRNVPELTQEVKKTSKGGFKNVGNRD